MSSVAKSLDIILTKTFGKVKVNNVDKTPLDKLSKNMILSQDVCLSMDTRQTLRNNNILIVGGSGSGKTRFEVKPNILQANCSFVVTDPSGEILQTQGKFLREMGYELKVFNLNQMQYSHSYNPFEYIRDEQGVLTMINALIKNTTAKGATSADPFWEKAEQALLQAICFYLYYECRKEDRNFSNVMKLLRCAEVREDQEDYESTLDLLFKEVEERDPEHIGVRMYKIFKQGAGKTAKSILITCSTRLQVFNMQKIAKLTNVDTIDLKSIGDKKTALFCITPVGDQSYNFLVALLYTQLFQTLYFHAEVECPNLRLPVHVRFMLDEFANIGTIPDFEEKLATMRKYEISCTIIIQNMSQLKTMYEKSWESITGNCDTFIFLGGQEQSTLEYVSKMIGKETIVTQTDSRNFGGHGGGGSRSKQIIGRELMMINEIGQMDTKNMIIQIRGLKPFFTKKYDYTKHPNYKYTGDANDANIFHVQREINIDDLERKYNAKKNYMSHNEKTRRKEAGIRQIKGMNAAERKNAEMDRMLANSQYSQTPNVKIKASPATPEFEKELIEKSVVRETSYSHMTDMEAPEDMMTNTAEFINRYKDDNELGNEQDGENIVPVTNDDPEAVDEFLEYQRRLEEEERRKQLEKEAEEKSLNQSNQDNEDDDEDAEGDNAGTGSKIVIDEETGEIIEEIHEEEKKETIPENKIDKFVQTPNGVDDETDTSEKNTRDNHDRKVKKKSPEKIKRNYSELFGGGKTVVEEKDRYKYKGATVGDFVEEDEKNLDETISNTQDEEAMMFDNIDQSSEVIVGYLTGSH